MIQATINEGSLSCKETQGTRNGGGGVFEAQQINTCLRVQH